MNRQRQLDGAEIWAEVAACARDRVDQKIADLRGESGQLLGVEALDVLWAVDVDSSDTACTPSPDWGLVPGSGKA
jgi:hypothetical protein